MIKIELSGDEALHYLQNENKEEIKYTQLLKEFNEFKQTTTLLGKKYVNLQEKYDKLLANTTDTLNNITKSSRVKHDTELANDIKSKNSVFTTPKHMDSTIKRSPFEIKEVISNIPKYKSRLSKLGQESLDELSKGKLRSRCNVKQFAARFNVRPATVCTFIEKHSNNKYKLILGKDVPKKDIWDGATVEPKELYFTKV